jgi:AcrR family transcriptional regulator
LTLGSCQAKLYWPVQYQTKDDQLNKSAIKRQAILDTAYGLFRTQGFAKTSMAEVTARVGGSKATIYGYFPSKEELFAECMTAAVENYLSDTLQHLDASRGNAQEALRNFGISVLQFICSPEQVEVRRLIIAEAARSGTGKLFFDKITALRAQISAYLESCMVAGTLRRDDPRLAADYLGALLEAEVLEPLLLQVNERSPRDREIVAAAKRAVDAFLRAYSIVGMKNVTQKESNRSRVAKVWKGPVMR